MYIDKSDQWSQRLPMLYDELNLDVGDPALSPNVKVWSGRSWLMCKETIDVWGIGCVACSGVPTSGRPRKELSPYSTCKVNLNEHHLYKLTKHHESVSHRLNVAAFLNLSISPSGTVLDIAPCAETFKIAWDKLCEGASIRKGLPGICGEKKFSHLVKCLAEAMWSIDRSFVKKAVCLSLHRDERKGRLLIRFRAVDGELNTRSGILGQVRSKPGSIGICNGTIKILNEFCTIAPQHRSVKLPSSEDVECMEQMIAITESITVDSASDELLASKLLAQGSVDEMNAIFTNQRMEIRDKTHASRKICERTIKADPKLKHLVELFIMKKGSIIQVIQHSPDLSREFERAVQEGGGNVKNLRAAKHRFESYATPSWRFCMHSDALCHVAAVILGRRDDCTLREHADTFLRALDEEAMVCMAFVADFSQDCLEFTRWLDDEEVDNAEIYDACAALAKKLRVLYQEGEFIHVGCTEKVVKALKHCRILTLRDGSVKSLGGSAHPTAQVLVIVIQMAKCASKVALQILQAHFPAFDLFAAFSVFSLAKTKAKIDTHSLPKRSKDHIAKLAAFFDADENLLKEV